MTSNYERLFEERVSDELRMKGTVAWPLYQAVRVKPWWRYCIVCLSKTINSHMYIMYHAVAKRSFKMGTAKFNAGSTICDSLPTHAKDGGILLVN